MMVFENLNNTSDYAEKVKRCQEYVYGLEEERRKIQVFQRELPLCLQLVTQAIETCKQQLTSGATHEYNLNAQSECCEQTSSEGPVLEEFMPIKSSASSDVEEKLLSEPNNNNIITSNDGIISKDSINNENRASKQSDWLRSVQLWNQTPDPTPKEDSPRKVTVEEVKGNGSDGAFHPLKSDEKRVATTSTSGEGPSDGGGKSAPVVAVPSSSAETGGSYGGSKKEEKEGQSSQRKQRRCWSPELHRRFLEALQQLGGSHVATPKQIRELMKVEGLTNDEVKSHLQKYRLHTRRPNNNTNPQAPQFVVVGGIWVPPPEYAARATPAASGEASGVANSAGIYAPVASLPPTIQDARRQHKPLDSNDRGGSIGKGGARANSPDSSSSDTTTASPPAAY